MAAREDMVRDFVREQRTGARRKRKGHYVGFSKLKGQVAARGGVRDPAAVVAAIGRAKYGKKRFQAAAAKGRKLGGRHAGAK